MRVRLPKKIQSKSGQALVSIAIAGALGVAALVALSSKVSQYSSAKGRELARANSNETANLVLSMVQKMFWSGQWTVSNDLNSGETTSPIIASTIKGNNKSPIFISSSLAIGAKTPQGGCSHLTQFKLIPHGEGTSQYCNPDSISKPTLSLSADNSGLSGLFNPADSPTGKQFAVIGLPDPLAGDAALKQAGKSLFSSESFPLNNQTMTSHLIEFKSFTFTPSRVVDGILVTVDNNVTGIVPLVSLCSVPPVWVGGHYLSQKQFPPYPADSQGRRQFPWEFFTTQKTFFLPKDAFDISVKAGKVFVDDTLFRGVTGNQENFGSLSVNGESIYTDNSLEPWPQDGGKVINKPLTLHPGDNTFSGEGANGGTYGTLAFVPSGTYKTRGACFSEAQFCGGDPRQPNNRTACFFFGTPNQDPPNRVCEIPQVYVGTRNHCPTPGGTYSESRQFFLPADARNINVSIAKVFMDDNHPILKINNQLVYSSNYSGNATSITLSPPTSINQYIKPGPNTIWGQVTSLNFKNWRRGNCWSVGVLMTGTYETDGNCYTATQFVPP